ncbi:sce7726 family protein [Hymenobacter sp. BT507]|uniref:Sce7726 family protein n=1 Tax=Hymenobacter citatus TaxID=2763506 RepID=A0ABR7MQP3_9BACT|nr:sce7726 family protein [Hymenobacter citatus]MBC6613045.1 sce7726 family protein [Hymenobacter citatus]
MNDPAIRALLYPLLTEGVYIEELPTGGTRADLVHITEQYMHCYEIKGSGDTLYRAVNQLDQYKLVYDFVTFVVAEKHVPKLMPLLPEWVGVMVATPEGLTTHRAAGYNSAVERTALGGLLMVDELRQFMLARGLRGVSTMQRREVMHIMRHAHNIPVSHWARYTRERLTARLPVRTQKRAERKALRESQPPREPWRKTIKRIKRRKRPRGLP